VYSIVPEYGIHVKLVKPIKLCLNETNNKIRIETYLSDIFPIKMVWKKGQFNAIDSQFRFWIYQWEDSSKFGGVEIEWDTLASDLSGLERNAEKAKYMIMCPGEKRTKPGHKYN